MIAHNHEQLIWFDGGDIAPQQIRKKILPSNLHQSRDKEIPYRYQVHLS